MSRKILRIKKLLQKSSTKVKALIPSVQKSNRNNNIKKRLIKLAEELLQNYMKASASPFFWCYKLVF